MAKVIIKGEAYDSLEASYGVLQASYDDALVVKDSIIVQLDYQILDYESYVQNCELKDMAYKAKVGQLEKVIKRNKRLNKLLILGLAGSLILYLK